MNKRLARLKSRPIFFWLLIIVVVLCALVYFYLKIEWKEVVVDRGYSESAKKNPFLGAGMFLEKLGVGSHYSNKKSLLDNLSNDSVNNNFFGEKKARDSDSFVPISIEKRIGETDVVFLLDARGSLSDRRYQKLLSWVESGGTLVYQTSNRFLSKAKIFDAFMERFNLTYKYGIEPNESEHKKNLKLEGNKKKDGNGIDDNDSDKESKGSKDDKKGRSEEDLAQEKLIKKVFDVFQPQKNIIDLSEEQCKSDNHDFGYISNYAIGYSDGPQESAQGEAPSALKSSKRFKFAGASQPYFTIEDNTFLPSNIGLINGKSVYADYNFGSGRVVFGNDLTLWVNSKIYCFDHAFYLADLAATADKVWFIQNQDAPSLWTLLWSKAYLVVMLGGSCLTFYLWQAVIRFGPIKRDYEFKRRLFSEHLSAASNLLWRRKKSHVLLLSIFKDVLHQAPKKQPSFNAWSVAEKINWFAEIAELNTTELERLFQNVGLLDDLAGGSSFSSSENKISIKKNVETPRISSQDFIQSTIVLKKLKERL